MILKWVIVMKTRYPLFELLTFLEIRATEEFFRKGEMAIDEDAKQVSVNRTGFIDV